MKTKLFLILSLIDCIGMVDISYSLRIVTVLMAFGIILLQDMNPREFVGDE